ncbi:MAG TPA: chemotaxis protein CheW, partial [Thermosipho africanus]|nr:chemotaxis protein CheW [Thermosipho africanus]
LEDRMILILDVEKVLKKEEKLAIENIIK